MTRFQRSPQKKESRRQLFIVSPNGSARSNGVSGRTRACVRRIIDMLQQLALRRPKSVLLVEAVVHAMLTAKNGLGEKPR